MNLSVSDVVALLGVALPVLLPFAGYLYQKLLHRLPVNAQAMLEQVTSTVVSGVEQQANGAAGPVKKDMAIKAISEIAGKLGLSKYASPTVISMLVEAAVYELNQAQASGAAAVPSSQPAL